MLFNSPLHIDKADRIIEQFDLKIDNRVLDIGCGSGEFLVRIAEKYDIQGVGFDVDADAIKAAQAKAAARLKPNSIEFSVQDATSFDWADSEYDSIICIGAEFIFGGYQAMLRKLKSSISADGSLFIGTIFWKQEPTAEYLQLMNGENAHFDHLTNVELAAREGFVPLYVCRSNDDEWDDFESSITRRKYLEFLNQPSAQDSQDKLNRIKRWQLGYLKYGTETMGFGFYLFRKL